MAPQETRLLFRKIDEPGLVPAPAPLDRNERSYYFIEDG